MKVLLASCADEDVCALYADGMDMMTAHTVENFRESSAKKLTLCARRDTQRIRKNILEVSAPLAPLFRSMNAAPPQCPYRCPPSDFYDDEKKYISAIIDCCGEINEVYRSRCYPWTSACYLTFSRQSRHFRCACGEKKMSRIDVLKYEEMTPAQQALP